MIKNKFFWFYTFLGMVSSLLFALGFYTIVMYPIYMSVNEDFEINIYTWIFFFIASFIGGINWSRQKIKKEDFSDIPTPAMTREFLSNILNGSVSKGLKEAVSFIIETGRIDEFLLLLSPENRSRVIMIKDQLSSVDEAEISSIINRLGLDTD